MPKQIRPSGNAHQWPRKAVASVECRKRDVVVRVADWTRLREDPAFDVEVYVAGVYDWTLSKTFPVADHGGKEAAKAAAGAFAAHRITSNL